MRKHSRRRPIVPLPPRGLRPRLEQDQLRDLALAHITNLDDVASGRATVDVMWQMAGGVLTWSRVAQATGVGVPEMVTQLDLMHSVIDRWRRTGRVGFSGPEYQVAKFGVDVMDALAAAVDKPTAYAAAEWSEAQCNALRDRTLADLAHDTNRTGTQPSTT